MIVKNEAHCISKCLESVKPFIDYWVICDTGSTDQTEQVIRNTLQGIPGELHKNQWIDFSTNRNISLELARTKGDYTLFIDADDYLVVSNQNCFKNLTEPAYNILINHESIIYPRISLVNNKIPCKYVGVLHENLDLPSQIQPQTISGCNIHFGGIGARSKDPDKFIKDAEVFEKALMTEPNNSRYVFYCAQSYRDAATMATKSSPLFEQYISKAIEMYDKRSRMNGWIEETAISAMELGNALQRTKSVDVIKVLAAYTLSYRLCKRVEPLVYMCTFLRAIKLYDIAYKYAQEGVTLKLPETGLFIQPDFYSWRIQDELAIAAYYIEKYEEAHTINSQLLSSNVVPIKEQSRIRTNLLACTQMIKSLV